MFNFHNHNQDWESTTLRVRVTVIYAADTAKYQALLDNLGCLIALGTPSLIDTVYPHPVPFLSTAHPFNNRFQKSSWSASLQRPFHPLWVIITSSTFIRTDQPVVSHWFHLVHSPFPVWTFLKIFCSVLDFLLGGGGQFYCVLLYQWKLGIFIDTGIGLFWNFAN